MNGNERAERMEVRTGSIREGVRFASMSASSIFMITVMLCLVAGSVEMRREAMSNPFELIWVTVAYAAIGLPVGAIIAAPLSAIGGLMMCALSDRYSAVRHPVLWTIAGALIGASLMAMVPTRFDVFRLAFIITSAACAAVSRSHISWIDPRD